MRRTWFCGNVSARVDRLPASSRGREGGRGKKSRPKSDAQDAPPFSPFVKYLTQIQSSLSVCPQQRGRSSERANRSSRHSTSRPSIVTATGTDKHTIVVVARINAGLDLTWKPGARRKGGAASRARHHHLQAKWGREGFRPGGRT